MREYHRHLKIFLVLMLFGIILTPQLSLMGGIPKLRLEEVLVVPLALYLLALSLGGRRIEYFWGLRQTMLLAFPLFLFVSIAAGVVFSFDASLGDLNQLVRIGKYIIIYTLAISVVALSPDPERTKTSIMDWTLVFACLLALVTIQQYFNLGGLNSSYVPYLGEGSHTERLLRLSSARPVGMVGNPNELGFLFAVAGVLAVYRILTRFTLFYLVTLGLALVGVLLSGSRSALVACLGGMLVVGVLMAFARIPAKARFVQRTAAVAGALVLLALGGTLTSVYGDLLDRFEGIANPEEEASWQARLVRWEENIRLFQSSPVVGVGPLRRGDLQYGGVADNEWLLLLRSYGLAGTLFLAATFLLPHVVGRWDRTAVLALALYGTCALYMIPAAVFHSLALMPLVLILAALSDTTVKRKVLG